jgi:hypothetical protein
MNEIDVRMDEHIRLIIAADAEGKGPPPGKGQSWYGGAGVSTRVGRFPDGTYYIDGYYPVEEGYDDDFGSKTCSPWCKMQGRAHQHCHRTATTLADLLCAPTVAHSPNPTGHLAGPAKRSAAEAEAKRSAAEAEAIRRGLRAEEN